MLSRILIITLSFACLGGMAQNYEEYTTVDSLVVSTKWQEGKKGKPSLLFIKVQNQSSSDLKYTLGIDFFFEGRTVESSEETEYCLKSGQTKMGKLNGIYFQSSKLSNEDLKSPDFEFELTGLDIERIENCPKK